MHGLETRKTVVPAAVIDDQHFVAAPSFRQGRAQLGIKRLDVLSLVV